MLAEWKSLVRLTGPVSTSVSEPSVAGEGEPQAVGEGGAKELKAA